MMQKRLLEPKSVAVVGASRHPGKVGHEILANLIQGGYQGEIIPVNPKANELLGIKAYPDLSAHYDKVDLAVITTPVSHALDAVRDALNARVGAMVIITAGFRESGEEGAGLESQIAAMCRDQGVPLLGPNCLGLINTQQKLNVSFARSAPTAGAVSVFSQSGALLAAMLDWAAPNHLGFARMVSLGNKADLSEVDFIRDFSFHKETRVIAGYLESVLDGDRFIKAAEEASEKKPVIIQKVGITEAGRHAATSHTGGLAGEDIAYESAFRRAGVIRAESFGELLDFTLAFATQPIPRGNKVAILTNAGGPGVMAADAVEKAGLVAARLATNSATALRAKLPAAAGINNPVDVLGDADPDRYKGALDVLINDPAVDSVIVILTPQAMTQPLATAQALAEFKTNGKPVLAVFMGSAGVDACRPALIEKGIPVYPTPEQAALALRAMVEYSEWKSRPIRVVTHFPVNRRRAERIFSRIIRQKRAQVGEAAAKEVLAAYGFCIPEGTLARNAEEAVEAAARIGFPVALKIASQAVIHKSDMGGVRLGVMDAVAAMDAFDLLSIKFKRLFPEAPLDGVYVEAMAPRGREVIIGMARDPRFGPMLMFGLGGIFVEALKDVSFHLAPITANEAMAMLKSTRSYAMLAGARGSTPLNLEAVAEGLQRISQLVTDFPIITELDINPLIVPDPPGRAVVADARITIAVEKNHDRA